MNAGSSKSNLIMGLFDCEVNNAHTLLCEAAGVTAYPTLMFIGSGPFHDIDPVTKTLLGVEKSVGIMGPSPVPNTVKFQGNWQYTDSIYDWIRTMQGLSRFHWWSTKGFGRRLRNFMLPLKTTDEPLPVGIPGRSASLMPYSSSSSTPSGTAGTGFSGKSQDVDEIGKILDRTTTMMESVLLGHGNYTDMFKLLDERNAWVDKNTNTPLDEVYRNCVLEIALDYCQRVAVNVGTKIVEDLENSGLSTDGVLAASANLEKDILSKLSEQEPYCGIIETCVLNDMKEEACRPNLCPFVNDSACRYLSSCTHPSMIQDYAEALGLQITI
jgi:hypothetical protein